jgi:hypothetical protein
MKLHEAIDAVLAERPGRTYRELADAIKARGLYLKASDGLPAEAKQINARVKTARYRDRYRVDDDGRVFPA